MYKLIYVYGGYKWTTFNENKFTHMRIYGWWEER